MSTAVTAVGPVLVDRLWDAVLAGDEHGAAATLFAALGDGVPAEAVLLELIAPVQHRIGAEWAANRITVAQEHAATAINDRALAALSLHRAAADDDRTGAPARGRVLVACVDEEWHCLPARLVAEVLKLRGWTVDYLGAQVPTPHLINHIHQTGPDIVALSGSLATRLPLAHAAITAVQATGTPVLVGGAAFGAHGEYARLLGADAWAPDAATAADDLAQAPPARPGPAHQPIDDLPHLADQEYTMVTRTSTALVRTVMDTLADRFPAMRAYSAAQRARTAEDIAHIVDFLAVALYTDDDAVFSRFLTWTAGILTTRGVPAHSLVPALRILGEELKDFDRASRILRRALGHLSPAAEPAAAPDPRTPA
ncbi:cobalamin-dependent protein [Streptomyces sp. NPDC093085]|uniref:cobalamin B12-binding domain-containing protein n=1 Tax=Streptomyces sp. NPDC093085 TaxID=3155068 RepID=UPI003416D1BF